ncbi:MAG: hypothetical protein NC910_03700 [Candidatus Omnitrophica bacterium]|nr:hypothetical protein [Candidatus Omnitrophota bacterium]
MSFLGALLFAAVLSTSGPAEPVEDPSAADPAGEIFGTPVPLSNYQFARRVTAMFPRPWGANSASAEEQERFTWENLILHFEGHRRGITVSDDELERQINEFLKGNKQTFTRRGDPDAYQKWVKEYIGETPDLFENQTRYLVQIAKVRDLIWNDVQVTVTEEEMQQEFLNEKHHVGGEMVIFDSREEAQAFYEKHKSRRAWEKMKAADRKKPEKERRVRPVSTMTLEAYIELWGIPKEQIYAFHAGEIGSVAPPMPFGSSQWCVYRLLDKRSGDLADFPKERDRYREQIDYKNRLKAQRAKIDELIASANLKVFVDRDSAAGGS